MSLQTFCGNRICCCGVNRAPVLSVTDDRNVGKQRAGWSLRLSALHELAEVFPHGVGEFRHLPHNLGIARRHVCAFGFVRVQVVEDRFLKVGERFVLVPERQLFFASRQMEFPLTAAYRLKILAVVVIERLSSGPFERYPFKER